MPVKFKLARPYDQQDVPKMPPSEKLVLIYLRLREVEGRGGATREDMELDTGVSYRTLDRALTALKKAGGVERYTEKQPKKAASPRTRVAASPR